MKFLCLECDRQMAFAERELPGDGTLAAVFSCTGCGRAVAMLTNPMETRLVSSLGIEIGGRTVPSDPPLRHTRSVLEEGREDAFLEEGAEDLVRGEGGGDDFREERREDTLRGEGGADAARKERNAGPPPVEWTPEALERLSRVPSFVRGMVKRIYTDYARERELASITPAVMDRARRELGLEGM